MQQLLTKLIIMVALLYIVNSGDCYSMGFLEAERYRTFFTKQEDNLYEIVESGKLTDKSLEKYTIGNTIFLLVLDKYHDISKEDIKKDLAVVRCFFQAYLKKDAEFISYNINNMSLITSEYSLNLEELVFDYDLLPEEYKIFHENKKYPDFLRSVVSPTYFKFPRPKDMKFSLEVELDITEGEVTTTHILVYNCALSMKDRYLRLIP